MSRVDVTLGGKNAGFKKMLNDTRSESRKFGKGMMSAMNLGNAFSAANLGAMLIGNIKRLVSSIMEEFDRIAKISFRIDMDPSKLQRYGVVADLAGASLEKVNVSMSKMFKNGAKADAGLQSYANEFKNLGIDIKKFMALNTEEQFLSIADAYSKTTDKAVAYNAVSVIMGRAAMDLIPLLSQGSEGIRNMVDDMSSLGEEGFASIEEANDALTMLNNEFKIGAAQGLPVFFKVMITGWNVVSVALRAVGVVVTTITGIFMPLFNSNLDFFDKVKQMGENIGIGYKEGVKGMGRDIDEIGDAWATAEEKQQSYNASLKDAARETAAVAREADKAAAKAEVARERAEKAQARDKERALKDAATAQKAAAKLSSERKKKRGELGVKVALSNGNTAEAKRLQRVLELYAKFEDARDRLQLSGEKALSLAKREVELQDKITKNAKDQADLIGVKVAVEEGGSAEVDGLLSRSSSLQGGVDSLQAIGLGASGVNFGESAESRKLRDLAVTRNRELVLLRNEISELELNQEEARF